MNFWKSAAGILEAEITSADPATALHQLVLSGIQCQQVIYTDDLTVRFRFFRRDRYSVSEHCRKRGDTFKILDQQGFYYSVLHFFQRPVILACFVFLTAVTLLLPTRVLFFRVEGNETIPSRQILEAAQQCGIRFGASRRTVRSEKMKNNLLEAIPQLKWAGINTAGCVAIISVREREEGKSAESISRGVSSIVAAQDGYITSCTVTKGNGLCTPGQVVKKGQVLISGYTDYGLMIQATQAKGEVFAQTVRNSQVITPENYVLRTAQTESQTRYSLILGKKRINLWKDSGISTGTCGRMYKEYYITLPGGFYLPVCLAVDTITFWNTENGEVPQKSIQEGIATFARHNLLRQMIAGSILRETVSVEQCENCYLFTGRFVCSEMIGRVITEEIGDTHGKTS